MSFLKARQLLEYTVFQALLFTVKCLPIGATVALANGLAWFVHYVVPKKATRYAISRENLRHRLHFRAFIQLIPSCIIIFSETNFSNVIFSFSAIILSAFCARMDSGPCGAM